MDVLMRYAFFAARSVEIYTLDDLSAEIFYDYGYIHPDLEQDHHDGFFPLVQLIGAYVTSWTRFVGIVTYRTRYDAYLAASDRVVDKVFVSVTDPAALARFRDTHTLDVLIDLADLPTTRFEAKASYVLLSMVGASAKVPAISTLVEHGGLARSRRRDGTEGGPRSAAADDRRADRAHLAGLHRDPNRQRPRGPELLGPRRGGRVAGDHRARRDDPAGGGPRRTHRDRPGDRI